MDLTRKEFLVLVVGGAAAAACGGSSGPSGDCLKNGSNSIISQNTGHSLIVTQADISAGVAKTYDIRGTDTSHTHTVTLSAADMQALQKNQQVGLTSSTDGTPAHNHAIQIACL